MSPVSGHNRRLSDGHVRHRGRAALQRRVKRFEESRALAPVEPRPTRKQNQPKKTHTPLDPAPTAPAPDSSGCTRNAAHNPRNPGCDDSRSSPAKSESSPPSAADTNNRP